MNARLDSSGPFRVFRVDILHWVHTLTRVSGSGYGNRRTVGDTEHRGVRADPECKRCDDSHRGGGAPSVHAHGVAEVPAESVRGYGQREKRGHSVDYP